MSDIDTADDGMAEYLAEKRYEFRDSPEDLAELEALYAAASEIAAETQRLVEVRAPTIPSDSPRITEFLMGMVLRILDHQAP